MVAFNNRLPRDNSEESCEPPRKRLKLCIYCYSLLGQDDPERLCDAIDRVFINKMISQVAAKAGLEEAALLCHVEVSVEQQGHD